jgi:hypothetical protein
VFLLNGFATGFLNSPAAHPYWLAPLALLALLRALARPSSGRLLAASVAQALVISTSFLPVVVLVLIGVHGLALGAPNPLPARRRLAVHLGSFACAIGLAAPFLFPVLESLSVVRVWAQYAHRPLVPYHPLQALSLLTPRHVWDMACARPQEHLADLSPIARFVPYLGLVAALTAAGLLARGSRPLPRVALPAALLLALGLGRSFALPPFNLVDWLPGLRFVRVEYWGALSGLAMAVLTAAGVSRRGGGWWPTAAVAGGVLVVASSLTAMVGMPASGPYAANLLLDALFLGAGVHLTRRLARETGDPRSTRRALAALLLLELCSYVNPERAVRSDIAHDPPDFIRFLREKGGRVANFGGPGTLVPDWGAALGIPQTETFNSSTLPWYHDLYLRAFGSDGRRWLLRTSDLGDRRCEDGVLDHLAVSWVVVSRSLPGFMAHFRAAGCRVAFTNRELVVFSNPLALPPAYATPGLVAGQRLLDLRGEEAARVAVTEDQELLHQAAAYGVEGPTTMRSARDASVEVVERRNARLVLAASLPWPGVLVVADAWHPSWLALVDGEPAHVGRVNEALRGVALPAGSHRVEMRYRPRTLSLGLLVAALAAIAPLLLLWKPARQLMGGSP